MGPERKATGEYASMLPVRDNANLLQVENPTHATAHAPEKIFSTQTSDFFQLL